MEIEAMSPVEIRRKGIKALTQELGFVGMVRFLQQFDTGSGDYTKERYDWLQEQTVEEIFQEIQRKRNST